MNPKECTGQRLSFGVQGVCSRTFSPLPCAFEPSGFSRWSFSLGAGVAGAAACLEARALGLRVVLASKAPLEGGSTWWAQGGAAAPLNLADNAAHLHDTLEAGRGLCEPEVVQVFIQEARAQLERLAELGVPFAAESALEGGHGQARVRHAHGDGTGRAISEVLSEQLRTSGARLLERAFARSLLLSASGRVVGAVLDHAGRQVRVQAGAVLLATGGFGRVYPVTTAPPEGTGDGLALAYRAGAELRDLEFVQFHPTAFVKGSRTEGHNVVLVSEAVRGEGAWLLNGHGERFMHRYDPGLELAPRDVVARAVATEWAATGEVTLDLRHLGSRHSNPDYVQQRFPGIFTRLLALGINASQQPVPVQPSVHYTMGGVTTDASGRSTVPGLYAAGEVASSGLHGANRLASNSLTEGLVFGARAAKAAAGELIFEPAVRETETCRFTPEQVQFAQALVVGAAGLLRNGPAIESALARWPTPRSSTEPTADTRTELETGSLALIGKLLLKGALERSESRGAHWREDDPETSSPYHVTQQAGQVRRVPLGQVKRMVDSARDVALHER